jgi:hypothetical protein
MTWFKVDDNAHSHSKFRKCGLEAAGLWLMCGSLCGSQLTDGFVPEWFVKTWPKGLKLASLLVSAGLWERVEWDDPERENGWYFHDWDHFQPSRKQILAGREKTRERVAKHRDRRYE